MWFHKKSGLILSHVARIFAYLKKVLTRFYCNESVGGSQAKISFFINFLKILNLFKQLSKLYRFALHLLQSPSLQLMLLNLVMHPEFLVNLAFIIKI